MATTPHRREALATSLHRFGLQRDRMRAALARQVGLSQTDIDALENVEADGPLSQRDLGERLALTSGAITMLVDRLEEAGLMRRRPHPTDRRYVLLELTGKAVKRAPAGLAAYHAAVTSLVAHTPPEHRAIIARFLDDAAEAAGTAAEQLQR